MKLPKNKAWLLAYFLLFLIATVLCLRLVHEPDLWWQLRTGEYILEHKTVPDTDVFSFTYEGKPWLNVKWGFEVIQASVVKSFGAEFLILPQIAANLLLLFTIFFLLRQFSLALNITRLGKFLMILLLLIGLSYRMNGRPELTTYLFTAIYLLIFTSHSNSKERWIFALIPLQLLWANLHEAFGVGMVMMGIYLAATWFEFFIADKKTTLLKAERNKTTLIIIAAFLVVMIHPSGTRMLFHPYEIFTQLSENQFTAEIFGALNKAYWKFPAFMNLTFLLLSILALLRFKQFKKISRLKTTLQKVPLFYLLLFVAFFYLSLKSYRNIPFFLIVSAPLVALQISKWTCKLSEKKSAILAIATTIAFYLSIVTNAFYKGFLPAEVYGVGINAAKNPVGAARFLADNNIQGKGFTDYLGSSYLLWKLQPEFKTFVDLRDLDVFAADDIEIALTCCTEPQRKTADGREIWQLVNGIYDFDYVAVLNNEAFMNFHRYMLNSNDFKLVYADELSSVYLKNSAENQKTIVKFAYDGRKIPFRPTITILPSKAAKAISSFFWPLHSHPPQKESAFLEKREAYRAYIGLESMK